MRILLLCKKFPFPLKDGESIAINNLAKAMANNGMELVLLAMNTTKHYLNIEKTTSAQIPQYHQIHTVKVDNSVTLFGALSHLLQRKSYNIGRFYSKAFESKLIQILGNQTFDIIQLETIYLTLYLPVIRRFSRAKVVLRPIIFEN